MKQLVNDLTRGEVTFDLFYSNTQNLDQLDQYITIKDMLFFFFFMPAVMYSNSTSL